MSKTPKEIIGEAVGGASMCWSPIPQGVFDSEKACKITDQFLKEIEEFYTSLVPKEQKAARDCQGYLENYANGRNDTIAEIHQNFKRKL